ncbi:hypothetical protein CTN00_06385 [Fusobacterium pseudoperiodonticum]|jgi:hypothetical protein|uniref:Uncharacterized protein n=1 Tax=Fusobacterium pseudoperiodonticum TaxID=2663009 RepID=A0A2G9EF24_9FUSO|nr:hypothetical protein [Fusobacterium pseudoperiodonticum]ATV64834.1 hypothetical protein CTM78_10950 [Fusobacterium pseudoperiodonticum]ATV68202.1 hypothetical protein CTM92_05965 [Fusobacterium pseudoperiodonticum]ATV72632.1 hypothetical protein CTN00_06385 [Fusobacterium pseudoperiodonticum]PIM79530.1 hypothetical protein CTM71_03360 [Fusobacterium pseudoperiodonticum]
MEDRIHFKLDDIHLEKNNNITSLKELYKYIVKDLLEVITLYNTEEQKLIPTYISFNNNLNEKIRIFEKTEE